MYQSVDPQAVRRRLLRFRRAFLSLNPDYRFVVTTYDAKARTEVRQIVIEGLTIDHYVFGPDAIASLGYPVKGAAKPFVLIPGNSDVVTLLFRRLQPQYAQYWMLEDDVEYSGDARELLHGLAQSSGDLLATHLARSYPSWTYAAMLRSPDPSVTPEHSWLIFLTFYRVSAGALDLIDRYYRNGWDGHSEHTWATILKHGGMQVVDIGGQGEFVADADRGQRYLGQANDGFEKSGSFGTRTIRLGAGARPDTLWHPIKTPRAFVRQTAKRWLSIARWYLGRLTRAQR